jgi:hypothetical protein
LDGSEPGSEPGSEANGRDASGATASTPLRREKDAQTEENQTGGYPERVVPPFQREDRALVNDLLYQARLLQDAVSAAAERLNPANPESRLGDAANHICASPTFAEPEEEERFVEGSRFRYAGSAEKSARDAVARRFSRRSHKLDLLRSIGHMANPTLFSPVPDGLACESPALDARARRRPLGEPGDIDGDSSERRRSGDEILAAASLARERRVASRDEDSPSSSAYGSSPAFDESASMRRRRLEGLLEPRQLF